MTIQIVDSYAESNQNAGRLLRSGDWQFHAVGQCFTPNAEGPLTSCKFYIEASGSPTGYIYAKLYAMTGTYGTDGKPTGDPLATSDPVDAETIGAGYALQEFIFSTPYVLVQGVHYVITIEYSDGIGIYVGVDTSAPTHPGNYIDLLEGVWDTDSDTDTCFYVYADATVQRGLFFANG